jgi:hypothetical protein
LPSQNTTIASNVLLMVVTSPSGSCMHPTVTPPLASPTLMLPHGDIESSSGCPADQSTSETLRMLLGSSTMPSGEDVMAKLLAAAPEVYED